MSIYVDESRYVFGRMMMCHMIADTPQELLSMADTIGVARKWLQAGGTYREHFDICKSKRLAAIQKGAIELSTRELGQKLRDRRLAVCR